MYFDEAGFKRRSETKCFFDETATKRLSEMERLFFSLPLYDQMSLLRLFFYTVFRWTSPELRERVKRDLHAELEGALQGVLEEEQDALDAILGDAAQE